MDWVTSKVDRNYDNQEMREPFGIYKFALQSKARKDGRFYSLHTTVNLSLIPSGQKIQGLPAELVSIFKECNATEISSPNEINLKNLKNLKIESIELLPESYKQEFFKVESYSAGYISGELFNELKEKISGDFIELVTDSTDFDKNDYLLGFQDAANYQKPNPNQIFTRNVYEELQPLVPPLQTTREYRDGNGKSPNTPGPQTGQITQNKLKNSGEYKKIKIEWDPDSE